VNSKELAVQRALGTLDTYWIEIGFPRREEPVGLDPLMADIMPTAIRFFNGGGTIFAVEAAGLHITQFMAALKDLIHKTEHNRGHSTSVEIYTGNDDDREYILLEEIE